MTLFALFALFAGTWRTSHLIDNLFLLNKDNNLCSKDILYISPAILRTNWLKSPKLGFIRLIEANRGCEQTPLCSERFSSSANKLFNGFWGGFYG